MQSSLFCLDFPVLVQKLVSQCCYKSFVRSLEVQVLGYLEFRRIAFLKGLKSLAYISLCLESCGFYLFY